jgi:hypothetical protein
MGAEPHKSGIDTGCLTRYFCIIKPDKIMHKKKSLEKTPTDDKVVFVSPEGIQSLETAIKNLEQIYKEMEKATRKSLKFTSKNQTKK